MARVRRRRAVPGPPGRPRPTRRPRPPPATTWPPAVSRGPGGRDRTACRRAPPRWRQPRRSVPSPRARAGRSRPGPIRPASPGPAPRPPRPRRPGSRGRPPPARASGGRSGRPARAPRGRRCRAPPGPRPNRAPLPRRPRSGCHRRTRRRPRPRRPRGRSARSTPRSCGTPVRAPLRSTTWIQRAPPRRSLGQGDRVAVARLPAEVTLGQAHRRPGRRSIAGSSSITTAVSARPHEVGQERQPRRPDFSGWNWAPHSVPRVANAATGPP